MPKAMGKYKRLEVLYLSKPVYYAIEVYHIQLRSKNISAIAAEVLPKIESIDFSAVLQ